MRRLFLFAMTVIMLVACHKESTTFVDDLRKECFDVATQSIYNYGYSNGDMEFSFFHNSEYDYWGGFAHSTLLDADAANGTFANQYAAYNTHAASGNGFLLYYYDSYNDPCDILFNKALELRSVKLNLTTYTYASITNEDINAFARAFTDGDYLKVIFTALDSSFTPTADSTECYIVDYRDGKRFVADKWNSFALGVGSKHGVRVTIETSDVGEYGPNTPLYVCLDDLAYTLL